MSSLTMRRFRSIRFQALLRVLALVGIAHWTSFPAFASDAQIRLNTIGFLPDGQKRASVAAEASEFSVVRNADGATVLSGRASAPQLNPDTNENLVTADFSTVREPGGYHLEVRGVGRSASFRIGRDVYNQPFAVVMRGMYLWRCGTAVSVTYNGQTFSHDACHLDDGWLDFATGAHVHRDGAKGWHDAGDYNKYVVNAGFTVGVMLQAWEQFGSHIEAVKVGIPQSHKNIPEFLDEVRWELDWLLTMQADDGSVLHKLSAQRFGGFTMPEKETALRYFVPWSSAATADFVAVMAMAARDYAPFDKEFADRCLAAARKSDEFLLQHPENHAANQQGFSTGTYSANDRSRRLWAAAELWQTTGDASYLADFEARAAAEPQKIDRTCGWGNVKNLGMYTYLLSKREGKDPALLNAIRKDLLSVADEIVKTRDAHGYGRPLGTVYYWGANGDVAQQVQTLQIANVTEPKPEYVTAAFDAIGYLFGRNYYGRSFVTGLGHQPPEHPHDRRSGAQKSAWPGYLIGGGWPKATDWVDRQDNYRVNEIAINWNATLIYALAGFVEARQ